LLICVFKCICITFIKLFNFKYFLQLHHNFTDTISNIPLTIAAVFSVSLRPDEQLQDMAVRLQCGQ